LKERDVGRRYNNQENQIKETTEKDVEKTVNSIKLGNCFLSQRVQNR